MPDLTTLFQARLANTGHKPHFSWDFYLSWLSGNVIHFFLGARDGGGGGISARNLLLQGESGA